MAAQDVAPKPKWWQLYLTFPFLLGLFVLDTHLHLSTGGHEALQLGSLLLEFVVIQQWLHANSSALNYMDDDMYRRTITVIEIPPSPAAGIERDARGAWVLPPLEIKGVLGDTFEMDYLDSRSAPVEGSAQAPKKG